MDTPHGQCGGIRIYCFGSKLWETEKLFIIAEPFIWAKAIYQYFEGSKSIMGHEGFLREYKSYQVTPEQEALWQTECNGARQG